MSCISDSFSSQPFPHTGRLKQNMNLSLEDLRRKIGATDAVADVYSYIIASVKNREGAFIQKGSAPNFQGDIISLCTCKHFMRTFRDIDSWMNTWIAGFTGINEWDRKNVLIYLMKIGSAFESYDELWFSDKLHYTAKQAKLAHRNKFGDIFQPKSKPINKNVFNHQHYRSPVSEHGHKNENGWHKDINYKKHDRRAALLIGDKKYSFLWDEPILFHLKQLHRGQKKYKLQSLLALIRQVR
ncbi:MAG: hypothetical protein ABSB91_02415 [Sedimentisphaerales bacterium]